jgi:uncharacterized tellurite resistance protein B-like protein
MKNNKKYQLGLLYLIHLLINADGVIDEKERAALLAVKEEEQISEPIFHEFENETQRLKEREIYQVGIEFLNECSRQEKLNAFVHLYRIAEADGSVHVKEVRLLLYSIRQAGIEFDDVVRHATHLNS